VCVCICRHKSKTSILNMHDRRRKIWRKKEERAKGGEKIELQLLLFTSFNKLIYINLVKILIID